MLLLFITSSIILSFVQPTLASKCGKINQKCLHCICQAESNCTALRCKVDSDGTGQVACGYFQIKMAYFLDCGQPGKRVNETTETAWQRCAQNMKCSISCIQKYVKVYAKNCPKAKGCERMARLHHGGPLGCTVNSTKNFWFSIKKCLPSQ